MNKNTPDRPTSAPRPSGSGLFDRCRWLPKPFGACSIAAIALIAFILPITGIAAAQEIDTEAAEAHTGPTITGQVFDHMGAGVDGAKVVAATPESSANQRHTLAEATTNDIGDFLLTLPPGTKGDVIVTVHQDGFAPFERTVQVVPDAEFPPFVDAEMVGVHFLVGLVTDAAKEKPIAGAAVSVEYGYRREDTTTNASGEFKLASLPPGPARISVEADGFGRERIDIESIAEEEMLDVQLRPARDVTIRVSSDSGEPVSGATIECIDQIGNATPMVVTDDAGKASIKGLSADTDGLACRVTHEMHASSNGYDHEFTLNENGAPTERNIVMQSAGVVIGTVVDAESRDPLSGARVVVGEYESGYSPRDWSRIDGTFRVAGAMPGSQPVTVHRAGYAPELIPIQVEPAKSVEVRIAMKPAANVGGKVVGKDGKPVAGAHVWAGEWRGQHTLGLQALTDTDGRFTIIDAPSDEFRITVAMQGYEPLTEQTVKAPRSDYTFELVAARGNRGPLPGSGPTAGEDAPAFKLTSITGQSLDSETLKGKVILLDFWATWCGPCIGEIPHLLDVYKQFGSRDDFILIGVSLDADAQTVRQFVNKKKIPWPQCVGQAGGAEDATRAYGVTAIPSVFLINGEGKIIATDLRGKALESAVGQALKD